MDSDLDRVTIEPDKDCFYCDNIGFCNFLYLFPHEKCQGCEYKQPKTFQIPERKCEFTCPSLVENELCKKGPCYNDGRKPVCCFKCGFIRECGLEKCTMQRQ